MKSNLIDDPDLMLHPLCVQEAGDVRRKLHQLLIPGIGVKLRGVLSGNVIHQHHCHALR